MLKRALLRELTDRTSDEKLNIGTFVREFVEILEAAFLSHYLDKIVVQRHITDKVMYNIFLGDLLPPIELVEGELYSDDSCILRLQKMLKDEQRKLDNEGK